MSLTGKSTNWSRKPSNIPWVSIASIKRRGTNTVELQDGCKLLYSGVEPAQFAQAGVSVRKPSSWQTVLNEFH